MQKSLLCPSLSVPLMTIFTVIWTLGSLTSAFDPDPHVTDATMTHQKRGQDTLVVYGQVSHYYG